ncbi:potassium-transporting ATPase B chain [Mobilicoccus pelagius NBRC 104925]|uniref:Potassium-transporting ATPase B chain n=1 Tax=Mobilicoccus pelagius NBRC 104925 TaxID=1089455 RepID=H5UVE6_9MICO|nr:potassium-transporting ATPase B chain [Mobilicoccus pelagius NBRC 104925]
MSTTPVDETVTHTGAQPHPVPEEQQSPVHDKHRGERRTGPAQPSLGALALASLPQAFAKLDPRHAITSPVLFVVWIGSVLTTVLTVLHPGVFSVSVTIWLWLTLLFANVAEAVAEGRGKAQAATLRATKKETTALRLRSDGTTEEVPGAQLTIGDLVVVEANGPHAVIPGDGDVVEGVATVDESAITGESAPVIRESGGDRCAVTGGTTVLSDRIVVRITTKPGESFIDRMIALVEGAERQKTPNEIALGILLVTLTIIFLLAVVALAPMAAYSGVHLSVVTLVALLVCLIPTTIGALLSAIGIAGMDRLVQRNVLAKSGRAVEAAGDVSTLLLDKTGTITFGNRRATEILPVAGHTQMEAADAAYDSSLADETPRGALDRRARRRAAGGRHDPRRGRPGGGGHRRRPRERGRGRCHVRRVHRPDPHVGHRPRRRQRRPQGRGLRRGRVGARRGRAGARRHDSPRRRHRRLRWHPARRRPAGRGRYSPRRRRRPPQGRRQARHEGAVRRAAPHGHQDRDDHRRQPPHRPGHRGRGRRRRLPRRGHTRGQDGAHQEGTVRRPPRRDDRRRHQRRARPGPGRRRRRDEHRHVGRQGGRQHGRPRLRPDQAHRDRRHRQAAAHHPRRAHDVLHRQRRRQVLRDHPGDVRHRVPGPGRPQRHAPAQPGVRDALGRRLQRAHHRRAHPAVAAGRRLPAPVGRRDAAPQPARLRPGRRRRPVRRHQAHRHDRLPPSRIGLTCVRSPASSSPPPARSSCSRCCSASRGRSRSRAWRRSSRPARRTGRSCARRTAPSSDRRCSVRRPRARSGSPPAPRTPSTPATPPDPATSAPSRPTT